MYRVYIYQDQTLFLENANSPIGRPIGTIIETGDHEWSYFPSGAGGLNIKHMGDIIAQLRGLNTKHEDRKTDDQPRITDEL